MFERRFFQWFFSSATCCWWSKDFEEDFDSVKRIGDTDSEVEAEGGDNYLVIIWIDLVINWIWWSSGTGDFLDLVIKWIWWLSKSGDKLDLVIMIRWGGWRAWQPKQPLSCEIRGNGEKTFFAIYLRKTRMRHGWKISTIWFTNFLSLTKI